MLRLMSNGHWLASLLVMGVILAAWKENDPADRFSRSW
jgi:hypothetical protein